MKSASDLAMFIGGYRVWEKVCTTNSGMEEGLRQKRKVEKERGVKESLILSVHSYWMAHYQNCLLLSIFNFLFFTYLLCPSKFYNKLISSIVDF